MSSFDWEVEEAAQWKFNTFNNVKRWCLIFSVGEMGALKPSLIRILFQYSNDEQKTFRWSFVDANLSGRVDVYNTRRWNLYPYVAMRNLPLYMEGNSRISSPPPLTLNTKIMCIPTLMM